MSTNDDSAAIVHIFQTSVEPFLNIFVETLDSGWVTTESERC